MKTLKANEIHDGMVVFCVQDIIGHDSEENMLNKIYRIEENAIGIEVIGDDSHFGWTAHALTEGTYIEDEITYATRVIDWAGVPVKDKFHYEITGKLPGKYYAVDR